MDFWQQLWHNIQTATLPTGPWIYPALAVLTAVEGPIATLLGGALAATGRLHPAYVFLAAGAGNFTADAGWYLLGRWGHFPRLMRHIPALRRFAPQIAFLRRQIDHHGPKMVLISKLSLGVAVIPALITAGMARVSWRRLVPISIAAEIVWTGSLVVAGYFLGDYLRQLESTLQQIGLILGVLVLGGSVLFLYRGYMQQRFDRPTAEADTNNVINEETNSPEATP